MYGMQCITVELWAVLMLVWYSDSEFCLLLVFLVLLFRPVCLPCGNVVVGWAFNGSGAACLFSTMASVDGGSDILTCSFIMNWVTSSLGNARNISDYNERIQYMRIGRLKINLRNVNFVIVGAKSFPAIFTFIVTHMTATMNFSQL